VALAIPKFYHPKAMFATWLCRIPLVWDTQWCLNLVFPDFMHCCVSNAAQACPWMENI